MRVRAWLTTLDMAWMMVTAFLAASDREKRPRYTKKEDVILMGIPSNRGGAMSVACTV